MSAVDRVAVAVVGGGPAGLAAADALAERGIDADVFDAMPTVGRKFLIAGRGGLNLTHGEPIDRFVRRYRERADVLGPIVDAFPPNAVRAWAASLGVETFVGSSGRVFPRDLKAARLLRAWVRSLRARGVRIHARHRWAGGGLADDDAALRFDCPGGTRVVRADAIVFALGGGSYGRLGSDGSWVAPFVAASVAVRPLVAANVGVEVAWSAPFRARAAGVPLKNVVVLAAGESAAGEVMVTDYGLEGNAIYALGPAIRESRALEIDLRPGMAHERLVERLARPRGSASFSTWLRKALKLEAPLPALVRECAPDAVAAGTPDALARAVRGLAVRVVGTRPVDEAISTAGGVDFAALDDDLMLRARPGVFVAGEMLDFEAPTGGYLLQGAISSGRVAGAGAAKRLRRGLRDGAGPV